MKYISKVLSADFKNVRRDPTLLLLLGVPVLMVFVCRIGIPLLLPFVPEIIDYYEIIVLFLSMMNAMFPAFIVAFILLDEKDLHLHSVLKVTPVSLSGLLKARLGFLFILSFTGSLMLLLLNGIYLFSLINAFVIAVLCALSAPILTLLIAAIAKNKVEGLTLLKVANVTLFIPILAYFIQSPWEYLLGIFPAFWPVHLLNPMLNSMLVFIFGTLVILLMNYWAFRYALKRLGKS